MQVALKDAGFEGVHLWTTFFEHGAGTDAHEKECLQLAEDLGAPAGQARAWAVLAADLHLCALGHAGAATRRVAEVGGFALRADYLYFQKAEERAQVKRDLTVLEATR